MIGCKKTFRNFRTNHGLQSSFGQQKEFVEILGRIKHLDILAYCLVHEIGKQKQSRMEKKKLGIAMQILLDVFVKFQDTRDFIDEKLEEKFASENISVEELTYFSLLFFFGNESLSLILKIAVFSSTLIYGLLYNKKRCKITSLE